MCVYFGTQIVFLRQTKKYKMENFSIVKANHSLQKRNSKQFLKIDKSADTNYVVMDSVGKVELTGKLDNSRKIDVQSLARGIYFILFSNADHSQHTQHFIKM